MATKRHKPEEIVTKLRQVGGGHFVRFDGINGSAGLTCSFSKALPNEVIDWVAGKSVSLTGVVYDVVLSTLYLKKCEFK